MGEQEGDGLFVLQIHQQQGDCLEDLEVVAVVIEHVLEKLVETELAAGAGLMGEYSKSYRVFLSSLMRV